MKYKEKSFSENNIVVISTKAYALLYNRFVDAISKDKTNINYYSQDMVDNDIKNGKMTRPILIIWSNKYHDKVIAVPQTTSTSQWNVENSFKRQNGKNFLKHEVLILKKEFTNLYNKGIPSEKVSKEEVNSFIADWSNNSKHWVSYGNFETMRLIYDGQAKQNIINSLMEKIEKSEGKE